MASTTAHRPLTFETVSPKSIANPSRHQPSSNSDPTPRSNGVPRPPAKATSRTTTEAEAPFNHSDIREPTSGPALHDQQGSAGRRSLPNVLPFYGRAEGASP